MDYLANRSVGVCVFIFSVILEYFVKMNFSTTIVLITGDIKCACELFIDERNI